MKERYSIFLEGTTTGGIPYNNITFQYGLNTLIPYHTEKKYILFSSFDTTEFSDSENGLKVSILINSPYNKSSAQSSYTVIGVADPIFITDGGQEDKFSYKINQCFPLMVDYPNQNNISIRIETTSGANLPNNKSFSLMLIFELL